MTPMERFLDALADCWESALTLLILAAQTGAVILCLVELCRGRPMTAFVALGVAWLAERVER